MNSLKDIIKNLKILLSSEKIEVTGNCLFENAVKIYISNGINESRNNKKDLELPNEKKQSEQPATDGQMFYFKKNGIKVNPNITKFEAIKIIDEHKRKK